MSQLSERIDKVLHAVKAWEGVKLDDRLLDKELKEIYKCTRKHKVPNANDKMMQLRRKSK